MKGKRKFTKNVTFFPSGLLLTTRTTLGTSCHQKTQATSREVVNAFRNRKGVTLCGLRHGLIVQKWPQAGKLLRYSGGHSAVHHIKRCMNIEYPNAQAYYMLCTNIHNTQHVIINIFLCPYTLPISDKLPTPDHQAFSTSSDNVHGSNTTLKPSCLCLNRSTPSAWIAAPCTSIPVRCIRGFGFYTSSSQLNTVPYI